ncbi:MAG: hypothetical protein CME60_07725 [Halobacteriovoraceae bacterium]|nr:hypothetical protein [Halobacteriovoraceae bacterium]|tara:strand:- start:74213 stop:74587 length:375 start_codon:yes stop_codon:yes gene_type:complete
MLADDEREDYMKKIIITMFLVLTGPFGIQLTHASQGALEGATEFSKIPVERMSEKTHADGFETFYGERFAVEEVVNVETEAKASEILKQNQIELKDGGIFYPEEVEFALRIRGGGLNKAPQTTD